LHHGLSRLQILLVVGLLVTSLTHATPSEKPTSAQQTILIMGDSISAGFGIDQAKGWVSILQHNLQQSKFGAPNVVNASVSGETTSGGKNRLANALKKYQPDLVVIELGGNDGLRGTPIKSIKQNLNDMILQSKTSGADVLLLGMRIPPNYGERYTELFAANYSKLAKEYESLFVPFLLEGVAGKEGMIQNDGIHPTEPAQPIMEKLVRQEVMRWLETKE